MTDRELVPTQSGFLELKAERAGMREGYRFLDEKRLILAGEILANLRDYDATREHWRQAEEAARTTLRAAVGRHGLEELSVYPPATVDCRLVTERRSVLGVRIEVPVPHGGAGSDAGALRTGGSVDAARDGDTDADISTDIDFDAEGDAGTPANRSPEADGCRAAFAALLPIAARLAVLGGNLERLRGEYLRTARRARALEDVLLPEMDQRLAVIENAVVWERVDAGGGRRAAR
jgi:V/A-type H+-transporting ATPase subunit D